MKIYSKSWRNSNKPIFMLTCLWKMYFYIVNIKQISLLIVFDKKISKPTKLFISFRFIKKIIKYISKIKYRVKLRYYLNKMECFLKKTSWYSSNRIKKKLKDNSFGTYKSLWQIHCIQDYEEITKFTFISIQNVKCTLSCLLHYFDAKIVSCNLCFYKTFLLFTKLEKIKIQLNKCVATVCK